MNTQIDEPTGASGKPIQGKSQSSRLVKLAVESGVDLFHHDDEAFAVFNVQGHRETHLLKSKAFRNYLARLYYLAEGGGVASKSPLQDAIGVLDAGARFEGPSVPVYTRLGEHHGAIYLDLCNEAWQVVKIDAQGWGVENKAPVRFLRRKGMEALPTPVRGGSLEELRPFVNVGEEDEWVLLVSWLVAALRHRGPYMIMNLSGEQGSAKSTTARVLRSLVDPNKAPLRSLPKDERDMIIAATNGWVSAFDNLSAVPNSCSDALCRLATGAGHAGRSLYTDDEEAIFSASRPIILTGIGDVGTRPDLLDRSLLLSLPNIEHKRRPEDEFWADFTQVQPRILGALLDAVVVAMQNLPSIRINNLPRMADFMKWATAAEPAFGWQPGTVMAAYQRNRGEADILALEACPLAGAVVRLLDQEGFWNKSATELLEALKSFTVNPKDLPQSAGALSTELRRIAPSLLRATGVSVDFPRSNKGRRIRLNRAEVSTRGEVTAVTA